MRVKYTEILKVLKPRPASDIAAAIIKANTIVKEEK